MNINTYNYSSLIKEFELRRSNLSSLLVLPSTEDTKQIQKELVKKDKVIPSYGIRGMIN
jgi:hypothetical protein